MLTPESITMIVLAYLIGSISSAILTCKLMGLPDPRQEGSKNPGATNVLRIGGKKAAIVTLLGDVLKGFLPVLLAKALGLPASGIAFVVFATFIGHLYPVFFGFKGGKGVATAFGGILALSPLLGSLSAGTWLLTFFLFRYSSLAALITALLTPVYAWYVSQPIYTGLMCIMSLLLIYRHRQNIVNLLSGREKKFQKRS